MIRDQRMGSTGQERLREGQLRKSEKEAGRLREGQERGRSGGKRNWNRRNNSTMSTGLRIYEEVDQRGIE